MTDKPPPPGALTAAMPNTVAWRLGRICVEAMSPEQKVGDPIDRGLVLLRLLDEGGFYVVPKPST